MHGNRGRASARRLDEAVRACILELVEETYFEVNDSHLAELLAEREGIAVSRVTLQRLLRGAGRAPRRRRRAPAHRSRRDRMARAGMLLQTDCSRHEWLGDRGPRLTLVGLIDDATGRVTEATFRDQEDTAGYLEVLATALRRHGVPGAVYHDWAGVFHTDRHVGTGDVGKLPFLPSHHRETRRHPRVAHGRNRCGRSGASVLG